MQNYRSLADPELAAGLSLRQGKGSLTGRVVELRGLDQLQPRGPLGCMSFRVEALGCPSCRDLGLVARVRVVGWAFVDPGQRRH